jgi:hypothetical protein
MRFRSVDYTVACVYRYRLSELDQYKLRHVCIKWN